MRERERERTHALIYLLPFSTIISATFFSPSTPFPLGTPPIPDIPFIPYPPPPYEGPLGPPNIGLGPLGGGGGRAGKPAPGPVIGREEGAGVEEGSGVEEVGAG